MDKEKLFDNTFYYKIYPDVLKAVNDGIFKSGFEHFCKHGINEKRQHRFSNFKDIYNWIDKLIIMPKPIIFEIGANHGIDTIRLASIKNATIHAFEPEPRCDLSHMPKNVIVNKYAISDKMGISEFNQSDVEGNIWTYSGSLLKPKNHLTEHKHVKFINKIKVNTISLDEYCEHSKIKYIDFIYMDVQGAEHKVFEGGRNILKKTKYIYTEYSNDEMYEGQKNLDDLMDLLDTFFIIDIWPVEPSNVLLENISCL